MTTPSSGSWSEYNYSVAKRPMHSLIPQALYYYKEVYNGHGLGPMAHTMMRGACVFSHFSLVHYMYSRFVCYTQNNLQQYRACVIVKPFGIRVSERQRQRVRNRGLDCMGLYWYILLAISEAIVLCITQLARAGLSKPASMHISASHQL